MVLPPGFGWSAGDIVISIQIVYHVSHAFRKVGGARDKYADTQAWLRSFALLVEAVRTFASTTPIGPRRDNILDQIAIIDPVFKKFEQCLAKYHPSLSSGSSTFMIKHAFQIG